MKAPTLLVISRHGESVTNKLMRDESGPFPSSPELADKIKAFSHQDVPLTEDGLSQADARAAELENRYGSFDVIISSGFLRAQQTAARYRLRFPDARYFEDGRLRERDPGYGYGMTSTEFYAFFPWMRWYWANTSRYLARPVGGESMSDVVQRLRPCLKEIRHDFNGLKVLIAAHGRTNQAARIIIEHLTLVNGRLPVPILPNCGYVAYRRSPTTSKLILDYVTS